LATNIFLYMISIAKWPPNGPSCNSIIMIYAFVVVKHLCNMLSWPILYNSPFFDVKGFALLTSLCFCCIYNVPSIWHVFKFSLTSFNHLGFMLNKLAFVVWSCTPVGFVICSNLDNAFAITWVLLAYTLLWNHILGSNSNHLTILLETCGLLTK